MILPSLTTVNLTTFEECWTIDNVRVFDFVVVDCWDKPLLFQERITASNQTGPPGYYVRLPGSGRIKTTRKGVGYKQLLLTLS